MTATHVPGLNRVCGTEDVVSEHRANCLCPKVAQEQPAMILDEHSVAITLLDSVLLEALDSQLTEQGAPMVRPRRDRDNEAGDAIGPEQGIRSCDAQLFWRVHDRVSVVLEWGAERGW